VTQSFNISAAPLTVAAINLTSVYGLPLPSLNASLGVTYKLSGFVNNDPPSVVSGAPALSTTAISTSNASTYPIMVSTGTLAAANYSFVYMNGTLTIIPAAPTVGWSTPPPASAAYNSQFTVVATSNSNGAITYSASGGCTNNLGVVTMTSSTTACEVSASVAAAGNYTIGSVGPTSVTATGPAVTVSPSTIAFGTVSLGSITTKTITVTNIGTAPVTINQPILSIVKGGNSNEFVAVNLCLTPLAIGKSCTITIAFVAGPFYTPQTATLEIMDNAPGSPQGVGLSATVLEPQTITFTKIPPSSATYNSSFTVAALAYSGSPATANGNPVIFTASGACSITGTGSGTATYTMTSGTGSCSVIANQAGNSTYAAAQVTRTVTATLATQTITFTTSPPSSAAYRSSFTVAASAYSGSPTTANGNTVTFTSSGACSNSGATYTISSSTGTCSVIANQAGNSYYAAAPQVTKTVTATLAAQTITFTTSPPASAAYKSSFTAAATGGASGNKVTFTSSGVCSNSGATYTMTSGTGTCSVIANQAGNSNYAAAPQVTQSVSATLVAQTITFTTSPPTTAAYKTSFTVAATGGASGNAVTFTSSGSCSNSGTTYTMTSGTGTCSVIANQAANSNYAQAPTVTKTVNATYSSATLTPTSLSFGTVSSGHSSAAQTATLMNTGTTPLIISSIAFTGTNPSNFTQTNTCPSSSSSLAAGNSCSISVTFKSGGTIASAILTVTDNTAPPGTQTVSVSGN
jgi:hypothetical protein